MAKEYVIGDTVPDAWQQRVDDVVAGTDLLDNNGSSV